MSNNSARNMIIIGGLMLIGALVLAWMMVLEIWPSTLFLNFLDMVLLVGGMVISTWGFFTLMAVARAKQVQERAEIPEEYQDESPGRRPSHSK